MVKDNLIEDAELNVTLGFDDFFRPTITSISREKP